MIRFEYPVDKPHDYVDREEKIKNNFKGIVDKYPKGEIIFTWDGSRYTFGSNIEMAELMDVKDIHKFL